MSRAKPRARSNGRPHSRLWEEKLWDRDIPFIETPPKARQCDFPGCTEEGLHRAPKSRDQINDYYWFCLSHVQAYNQSWDYFQGMDSNRIEEEMRRAATWERPTWRMGDKGGFSADKVRQKVWEEMAQGERASFRPGEEDAEERKDRLNGGHRGAAEMEALAVLDLALPVNWDDIKRRYKELVRKHHPDHNQGDPKAEERLKVVNQAYQILRDAHGEGGFSSRSR